MSTLSTKFCGHSFQLPPLNFLTVLCRISNVHLPTANTVTTNNVICMHNLQDSRFTFTECCYMF